MKLVQDKITIITGGTRGIGFAAAKLFIENGAKVSIFGETQEEVDTALAQLKELYPEEEVLGFAPDLTSRDAVMAAVGTVAQKYGRLDVMINNAGITMNSVFSRVSEEDFKNIMDINVNGVFNGAWSAYQYIGIMGSRSKIRVVTEKLLEDGFTREEIEGCHMPIGTAIGAETPAEIAVSIAGELIHIRALREGRRKC